MKYYKLKEIQELAREQGAKFAALANADGRKIVPFNTSPTQKISLNEQFKNIEKRLNTRTIDDGVYHVLLASTVQGCKKNYDSLAILKGNEPLKDNSNLPTTTIIEKHASVDVLTYEQALQMQKNIATLEFDKKFLEAENKALKEKVTELETVLNSIPETQQKPLLSEDNVNGFFSYASPMIEKYFELENRRIDILEGKKGVQKQLQQPKRQLIQVGSAQQLDMIQKFYEAGDDDNFNKQMDALEQKQPQIYARVMQLLGIEEEQEEENDDNSQE